MRAVWRLERGSVEAVRQELPRQKRGAYTTVQTVLNRLADRGLLAREKEGRAIIYVPRLSEADYVRNSLGRALAGASDEARLAAVASLVGDMETAELDEIRRLAARVARGRAHG